MLFIKSLTQICLCNRNNLQLHQKETALTVLTHGRAHGPLGENNSKQGGGPLDEWALTMLKVECPQVLILTKRVGL